MTPVLKKKFHWLPVRHCIVYKILSLVYKAINEAVPCYVSDKLNYRIFKRTLTSPSGDPESTTKDLWGKDVCCGGFRTMELDPTRNSHRI